MPQRLEHTIVLLCLFLAPFFRVLILLITSYFFKGFVDREKLVHYEYIYNCYRKCSGTFMGCYVTLSLSANST